MQEALTITRPESPRLSEEQLLETARLAAVGALAADVGHELNNPLFGMLGLVELLLREVEPGSKAAQRLALVEQTGLEMKQVIRLFVDFARDPRRDARPMELEEIVLGAVELAGRTSAARDIELVVRPAGAPLVVECGPPYVVAVLLGIVASVRKCLPLGGMIAVSLSRAGGTARIRVAGTGEQVHPDGLDAGALEESVVHVYGGALEYGPGAEALLSLPLAEDFTA